MAILTFVVGEGVVEFYGDSGACVGYVRTFGHGEGWILPSEALDKIQRIRGVLPGEASNLCQFLMRSGSLSEFRLRMAQEDWALLLDALPVPSEALIA